MIVAPSSGRCLLNALTGVNALRAWLGEAR